MTKLLEDAIARLRKLPDDAQDTAALVLMRYLAVVRYSDPKLEEAFRSISLDELDERIRRLLSG